MTLASRHSAILCFAALAWTGVVAAEEPVSKEIEANGMTITLVDQGTGEPILFVHGAISDERAWEPIRPEITDRNRFIALTLPYFGVDAWPDKGERFGASPHADDVIALIEALGTGPVDLVGWSYGANIATTAAVKRPDLVQALILYEPALDQFVAEGEAGDAAREAADRMFGPVTPAIEAGSHEEAARLLVEGVFQMPAGGFHGQPADLQKMQLDNARTMPLLWNAPPSPVTCAELKSFDRPTLIVHGAESNVYWAQVATGMDACLPNAEVKALPGVNHDGPVADPAGFAAVIEEFVTKH